MKVDTTIEKTPDSYRISSSRYDPRWVETTKSLPIRSWAKPYWTVPRHCIPIEALYEMYLQFGTVRIISNDTQITTPETIKAKYPFLYPFQASTVASAVNRGNFLVAHTMGLGKTLTGAAAALELSQGKHPILIIAPPAVHKQWQRELKRWFGRDAAIVMGTKKKRAKLWIELPPDHMADPIYIISYESLRMDWGVMGLSNHIVVADELSKIKNKSKIHKLFKEMAKTVKYRIGLSGTPISGKLEHYRNLMEWVNPGWMSWKFYEDNYTIKDWVTIRGGEKLLVTVGYRNIDDFVRRLNGYVDRKTKNDIGIQLPPRTIEWRYVPMDKYQSKAHDALIKYAKQQEEGILPVWRLLQTVADGTEVTLESDSEIIAAAGVSRDAVESPKLKELDNLLEEIGDNKVLIFTQFARFARRIQTHINKNETLGHAMLVTGETPLAEKEKIIKDFKESIGLNILVCTDALSMGVDFPFVNYEVQVDVPTDISTFEQRCERIHRVNSPVDKPKTVIMFYSQGIEEDVFEILQKKAELNEAITEGKALAPNINIRDEVAKKYGLTRCD